MLYPDECRVPPSNNCWADMRLGSFEASVSELFSLDHLTHFCSLDFFTRFQFSIAGFQLLWNWILIYFAWLQVALNSFSTDYTWFQLILNVFSHDVNWFQFMFTWFSFGFNLLWNDFETTAFCTFGWFSID